MFKFVPETGRSPRATSRGVQREPGRGRGRPGLGDVMPYDNASFDQVHDLEGAQMAMNFGLAATVNCPVVSMQ